MWASPHSRLASAACAALLALTACSNDPEADLEAGVAALLAARADDIAAHLEAGDACTADERIDALATMVDDATADGSVPVEVADEVTAVLGDLAAAATCGDDEPSAGEVESRDVGGAPSTEVETPEPAETGDRGTGGQADAGRDGRGPDGTGPPGHRGPPAGKGKGRGR